LTILVISEFQQPDNYNLDELELEMIDFGVEEIFADDEDGILMYAPFESFGAIQKELESQRFGNFIFRI
jgi:transcriptional/translational regulatory protein YebC/TACO1